MVSFILWIRLENTGKNCRGALFAKVKIQRKLPPIDEKCNFQNLTKLSMSKTLWFPDDDINLFAEEGLEAYLLIGFVASKDS